MRGKVLAKVEILKEVGRGGMAVVYQGKHTVLEKMMAVKILHKGSGFSDAESILRFQNEAKALARLDHPHIVVVYDFGEQEGIHYIITQYVDGPTLKQKIDREGALTPMETVRVMREILRGLDYAHGKGLIHRDIKPSNIMFDSQGNVRITDFGLVKFLDSSKQLTLTGEGLGTPYYMSPEQWDADEPTPQMDIWSLGVTWYYALSKNVPFPGDKPTAVFMSIMSKVAPELQEFGIEAPPMIEKILRKMLEKDTSIRYKSAAEVLGDLEDITSRRLALSTNTEVGRDDETIKVGRKDLENALQEELENTSNRVEAGREDETIKVDNKDLENALQAELKNTYTENVGIGDPTVKLQYPEDHQDPTVKLQYPEDHQDPTVKVEHKASATKKEHVTRIRPLREKQQVTQARTSSAKEPQPAQIKTSTKEPPLTQVKVSGKGRKIFAVLTLLFLGFCSLIYAGYSYLEHIEKSKQAIEKLDPNKTQQAEKSLKKPKKEYVKPMAEEILKMSTLERGKEFSGAQQTVLDLLDLVKNSWEKGKYAKARELTKNAYKASVNSKYKESLQELLKYFYLKEIEKYAKKGGNSWKKAKKISNKALSEFPNSKRIQALYLKATQENIPLKVRREYEQAIQLQKENKHIEALVIYQKILFQLNSHYQSLAKKQIENCKRKEFEKYYQKAKKAYREKESIKCLNAILQAEHFDKKNVYLTNIKSEVQEDVYNKYYKRIEEYIKTKKISKALKYLQRVKRKYQPSGKWAKLFKEQKIRALPKAEIHFKARKSIMIGQKDTHTLIVSNKGGMQAEDIRLEVHIPKGIKYQNNVDGKTLRWNLPPIALAAKKKITYSIKGVSKGRFTFKAKIYMLGKKERASKLTVQVTPWKRYVTSSQGVIVDRKTGLEWYVGPDENTNRYQAKKWVKKLKVAGGNWRLPTRTELKGIYQKGAGSRSMNPVFKTTGWYLQSSEARNSSSVWYFYLCDGNNSVHDHNSSNRVRVFAVRAPR